MTYRAGQSNISEAVSGEPTERQLLHSISMSTFVGLVAE